MILYISTYINDMSHIQKIFCIFLVFCTFRCGSAEKKNGIALGILNQKV